MRAQTILPAKLRPDVASQVSGVSKSTLLRWERERSDFPAPSRPTPRVTLYDRDRLMSFLEGDRAVAKA